MCETETKKIRLLTLQRGRSMMRAAIKKPLARALREASAKGLSRNSTNKDTIPQTQAVSRLATGLVPKGPAWPGAFSIDQARGILYGDVATEKNVVWFGSQALGGTIHRHSCTIERRFFASASWLCSFWASQAGSRKARRFLVPGLPTCLDSPFFRLEAKKGGKPFPPALGVQAMQHPFPLPAGSPSAVPQAPKTITINGQAVYSLAEVLAIIATAFCLGGGRHV